MYTGLAYWNVYTLSLLSGMRLMVNLRLSESTFGPMGGRGLCAAQAGTGDSYQRLWGASAFMNPESCPKS